jgi:hypothetical protein
MKKLSFILLFCLSMAFITPVFAQPKNSGGSGPSGASGQPSSINPKLENPFKCPGGGECTLTDLFEAIINNILIPIGVVAAVLAFIWSGFLFVMAQGEPAKLETAKRALLYTAIGTAILLGAWVITEVLNGTIKSLKS